MFSCLIPSYQDLATWPLGTSLGLALLPYCMALAQMYPLSLLLSIYILVTMIPFDLLWYGPNIR